MFLRGATTLLGLLSDGNLFLFVRWGCDVDSSLSEVNIGVVRELTRVRLGHVPVSETGAI